jgi:hypothetical protein
MKNSLLRDDLLGDQRGAVYVEFLLAFIPLFFMFLGMLQMGLLYGASLVVQHSANVAARAAMVVMDDDPQYYDDEGRRELETNASGMSSFVQTAGGVIGAIFGVGGSGGGGPQWTGGARLQAVEFAAGMPLLPLSPSFQSIARQPQDESVRGALGLGNFDSPEARVAWGVVYNSLAMRVTFPTAGGSSDDYHTDFPAPSATGDAGQIIARVTYLYNCQVPLANRLMCEDLVYMRTGIDAGTISALTSQFLAGNLTLQQFQDAMTAMQARSARRTRWTPRINELGNALNVLTLISGVSSVLGGPTPRFVPITAEASMPLQAANYRYHGGNDSTGWEQECDDGSCN